MAGDAQGKLHSALGRLRGWGDDGAHVVLFSGQPLGSAMVLWSVATIGMDYFEARFPWRGFALDWLLAALVIAVATSMGGGWHHS